MAESSCITAGNTEAKQFLRTEKMTRQKVCVSFFGMVKWTFQRLSDLQISNKKVTLNHLVLVVFDVFVLKLLFVCVILLSMCFIWIIRQKIRKTCSRHGLSEVWKFGALWSSQFHKCKFLGPGWWFPLFFNFTIFTLNLGVSWSYLTCAFLFKWVGSMIQLWLDKAGDHGHVFVTSEFFMEWHGAPINGRK